jgi:hypothetical protein
MIGVAQMIGALSVLAQPGGLHCSISGQGVLPNGDGFSGEVNINAEVHFAVPGSIWRHFKIDPSGIPKQVFIGRAESGACLPDGVKTVQLRGIGTLRGRSVEFEVFGRDRGPTNPDFYELTIRDSSGAVIYFVDGNLVSGGIIAVIYKSPALGS